MCYYVFYEGILGDYKCSCRKPQNFFLTTKCCTIMVVQKQYLYIFCSTIVEI